MGNVFNKTTSKRNPSATLATCMHAGVRLPRRSCKLSRRFCKHSRPLHSRLRTFHYEIAIAFLYLKKINETVSVALYMAFVFIWHFYDLSHQLSI